MSIQKAQLWLKNHSDSIPAIRFNHLDIIDENSSQELILSAAADPGMSLALLKKINANRGNNSSRDSVESIKSAPALLGQKLTHTLLAEIEVAEDKLDNPHQLFLFRQLINRSLHNKLQVTKWAQENGYQNIDQLTSSALLNYIGEILCCTHDFTHYLKYILAGSTEGDERNLFEFSFEQLTEAVCQQLNLAEIITNSQPQNKSEVQREKFLLFIAALCKQCEHGWYTPKQLETFQQFADFLQQSVDQVITKFHQFSVVAANQSIIPEAWQAASRLILIQDKAWTPAVSIKPKAVNKPVIAKSRNEPVKEAAQQTVKQTSKHSIKKPQPLATGDIVNRMKLLLKQPKVSQTDILNTCLGGLINDYSMSKVCFLLLSKDKQKLQNRIALGLDKSSPFRQFQIEVEKSGMLKILLNKPQSIWINSSNFKKYQKIIPQSLLVNIKTINFLAMSVFIGAKPIGIIYADRTGSTKQIDEKSFTQYKHLITLTSKALTILSKR